MYQPARVSGSLSKIDRDGPAAVEPHKRRGFSNLRAGKGDALLDEVDGPAGDGWEIEFACFVKRSQ